MKHGTSNRKLTDKQAWDVWDRYHNGEGETYKSLAQEYDVTPGTTRNIIKGKTYKTAIERGKNGEFEE